MALPIPLEVAQQPELLTPGPELATDSAAARSRAMVMEVVAVIIARFVADARGSFAAEEEAISWN